MSFRKRTSDVKPIPGTKSNLYNGQLITSSGNPSLDYILGGGLQVGSILLIEEDQHVTYSKTLAKYFLAEGVVSNHSIFLASADDDPKEFLKKLPKATEEKLSSANAEGDNLDMRIAWRYNDLPQVNSEQTTNKIGHNFNMLEQMSDEDLKSTDSITWNNVCNEDKYNNLIESINKKLAESKFSKNSEGDKSILRICLTSFASPLWYSSNFSSSVCRFLTILRAVVRLYNAVCFITIPLNLLEKYDEKLVNRIRNLVDYSILLDSFAGTDRENNPAFKEYNGILCIKKIAALNSLAALLPETTDLAFKLRRKKFVIEKFHLPPELQETESATKDAVPSIGCGSSGSNKLDF